MLLPGDVQADRFPQPRAHDQGVMFRPQLGRIDDGPARFVLHGTEAAEKRQVGAHDLLGQPEIRDQVHHSAGPFLLLVQGDPVAALGEHTGRAQTRGARAHDADGLAVGCRAPELRQPDGAGLFHHRGLHGRDFDRPVKQPARARLHAEIVGTHDATDPTQRIRPLDQGRRPAEVGFRPDARRHDEIGRRTIRGAGFLAGLFLAINAPVQLRPQLGLGEESIALFHGYGKAGTMRL